MPYGIEFVNKSRPLFLDAYTNNSEPGAGEVTFDIGNALMPALDTMQKCIYASFELPLGTQKLDSWIDLMLLACFVPVFISYFLFSKLSFGWPGRNQAGTINLRGIEV